MANRISNYFWFRKGECYIDDCSIKIKINQIIKSFIDKGASMKFRSVSSRVPVEAYLGNSLLYFVESVVSVTPHNATGIFDKRHGDDQLF